MRIKETTGRGDFTANSSKPPIQPVATPSLFATVMEGQQSTLSTYHQEIEDLRKDIEQAGETLEKEPTLPNFRQFRELLSKLAKRITSEAYKLEKVGGTPQNPRYYEIITIINTEADSLYNMIVKENKNNMAITARVIGIKGLVVDLIT